jgi:hypothetical protein
LEENSMMQMMVNIQGAHSFPRLPSIIWNVKCAGLSSNIYFIEFIPTIQRAYWDRRYIMTWDNIFSNSVPSLSAVISFPQAITKSPTICSTWILRIECYYLWISSFQTLMNLISFEDSSTRSEADHKWSWRN